jgi:hypothetical protein
VYKNTFDGGEFDKWFLGAVASPAYQRGVAWLENFSLLEAGGLNRRKGYKHIHNILQGSGDGAVKLIPFQVDDETTFLVYVSKSRLGYLKFSRYDLIDSYERGPPEQVIVPPDHVFQYFKKDPNAYFALLSITDAVLADTVEPGDEFAVSGLQVRETGRARVTNKEALGQGQATRFDDALIPVDYYPVTGTYATIREWGEGSGLQVMAIVGEANASGIASISFTVMNGGKGFKPNPGQSYTHLRFYLLNKDIITKGIVNEATGGITSVETVKTNIATPILPGQDVMLRYGLPPHEVESLTVVIDPSRPNFISPDPIIIKVTATREDDVPGQITQIQDFYTISFEVLQGGSGFVKSRGLSYTTNVELPYAYLVLRYNYLSENGDLLTRQIPVIARIGSANEFNSIAPVSDWTDTKFILSSCIDLEDGEWTSTGDLLVEMEVTPVGEIDGWSAFDFDFTVIRGGGGFDPDKEYAFSWDFPWEDQNVTVTIAFTPEVDEDGKLTGVPGVPGFTLREIMQLESEPEGLPYFGDPPEQITDFYLPENPDFINTSMLSAKTVYNRLDNLVSFSDVQGGAPENVADITITGIRINMVFPPQRFIRTSATAVAGTPGAIKSIDSITGWYDDNMVCPDKTKFPVYAAAQPGVTMAAYDFDAQVLNLQSVRHGIIRNSHGVSLANCYTPFQFKHSQAFAVVLTCNGTWSVQPFYFTYASWFQWRQSGGRNNGSYYQGYSYYARTYGYNGIISETPQYQQVVTRNKIRTISTYQNYPPLDFSGQVVPKAFYKTGVGVPITCPIKANWVTQIAWFQSLNGIGSGYVDIELDAPEPGDMIPEYSGSLCGSGAEISLSEYAYLHNSEQLIVQAASVALGTGYLRRPIDTVIVSVFDGTNAGEPLYEVELKAQGGTGGTLILLPQRDNPADPVISRRIPASYKKYPPEDGNTVVQNGTRNVEVTASTVKIQGAQAGQNGWRTSLAVVYKDGNPLSTNGFVPGMSAELIYPKNGRSLSLSFVVNAIKEMFTYTLEILDGGKFVKAPKSVELENEVHSGTAAVMGTQFHRQSLLAEDAVPPDHLHYKVATDETNRFMETIYRYNSGASKWEVFVQPRLPLQDAAINEAQYVVNNKIILLCQRSIVPLMLDIDEDDDEKIHVTALVADVSVKTDLTAPGDFDGTQENTVYDKDIPQLLFKDADYLPGVAAFINNRWWFSAFSFDKSRVFVSQTVDEADNPFINFSTYKNFVTITPEYFAFKAEHEMGEQRIHSLDGDAYGTIVKAMKTVVKGKDVSFGLVEPSIIGTPYLKNGAVITGTAANSGLVISETVTPVPEEYHEKELISFASEVGRRAAWMRVKYPIPGALCACSVSVDGFEVRTCSQDLVIGFANGVLAAPTLAVPETGWGNNAASIAGNIVAAAASASQSASPVSMAAIAGSVAGILSAARAVIYNTAQSLTRVNFRLTDGTDVAVTPGNLGLDPVVTRSDDMPSLIEYVKTRYRMYSRVQPFTLRTWKADEKQYSTPECGFTFTFTSDQKEGVNFITDNRSIVAGTDASERIISAQVSGEQQSAVTGSFFGSELVQAAKAQSSTYFVLKGGQKILRMGWEPNVPVPTVSDIQKFNKEILRGRKVLGLKADKSLPSRIWCVLDDGQAAVITDTGGGQVAWSRIALGGGRLLDTAGIPINGQAALRIAAKINDKGIQVIGIPETEGEQGDVFLDEWRPYTSQGIANYYTDEAVVYDTETGAVYEHGQYPLAKAGLYIGYAYTSKVRSLPSAEAQSMKPARIARVKIRMIDSHTPKIAGFPSGAENQVVGKGQMDGGRSGVWNVPVPGNVELDASFELYTKHPDSLSIIAWDTEEDA